MTLKLSCEYKELFEKIYKDNMYIEYVVSYNNGFIQFRINIDIQNIPTKVDELFKYHTNLINIYEQNNNIKILITINKTNKEHFKIQFIEEIIN
jgi:hypothetical protein